MAFRLETAAALVLGSLVLAEAQTSTQLSRPAFDHVPTREGYFSSFDGTRLFYRIAGQGGKTIVFLHGGPGLGIDDGGYDLEPLAARGYRMAMLNERGGGRSHVLTDTARLGIDSYVRDMEAFAEHLRVKKFSIATYTIDAAMAGSTIVLGTTMTLSAASDSVIEWAIVNAVTILITGTSRRAHNTTAIRNAIWS